MVAVKIAVWEYERGWGSKVDDYMVCLSVEDANAFKKEFNAKNNEPITPDWYMIAQGDPTAIDLTPKQEKKLKKEKRVWLRSFER